MGTVMRTEESTKTTDHSISSIDWLLVSIPGLIWGASFLFIAEGLKAVGPNGVTFVRIAIGFLTLAFFPAARKSVDRSAWFAIAALGVLWFAFPLSMFPYAEQLVSSALSGMLNGVVPLFVAIVAASIAKELPPVGVVTGIGVGIIGAALTALPSFHEGRNSTIGVLLIFAATCSYGFALNLARPLQQRYGALPVVWRALGVAALLTAPLGTSEISRPHWSWGAALSLLALGSLGTGIAFALLAMAVGKVGATRASAASFLVPPVALALGVIVRGEHVAKLSVIGCAVCVAGAWLIRPRPSTSHAPATCELVSQETTASLAT
jgi:drug/metabolite transporter (DMT)-like permease